MKEHPIIFNSWSVQRILSRDKIQTRRVIKPQPLCDIPGAYFDAYNGGPQWNWWTKNGRLCNAHDIINCPYGRTGDRLYIKESHYLYGSWYVDGMTETGKKKWHFVYEPECGVLFSEDPPEKNCVSRTKTGWFKRPSIFMPRWASRTTLEVTDMKAERVRDISEEDAIAEGIDARPQSAIPWFGDLWDSINKERGFSWQSNPLVWCASFKWEEKQ